MAPPYGTSDQIDIDSVFQNFLRAKGYTFRCNEFAGWLGCHIPAAKAEHEHEINKDVFEWLWTNLGVERNVTVTKFFGAAAAWQVAANLLSECGFTTNAGIINALLSLHPKNIIYVLGTGAAASVGLLAFMAIGQQVMHEVVAKPSLAEAEEDDKESESSNGDNIVDRRENENECASIEIDVERDKETSPFVMSGNDLIPSFLAFTLFLSVIPADGLWGVMNMLAFGITNSLLEVSAWALNLLSIALPENMFYSVAQWSLELIISIPFYYAESEIFHGAHNLITWLVEKVSKRVGIKTENLWYCNEQFVHRLTAGYWGFDGHSAAMMAGVNYFMDSSQDRVNWFNVPVNALGCAATTLASYLLFPCWQLHRLEKEFDCLQDEFNGLSNVEKQRCAQMDAKTAYDQGEESVLSSRKWGGYEARSGKPIDAIVKFSRHFPSVRCLPNWGGFYNAFGANQFGPVDDDAKNTNEFV